MLCACDTWCRANNKSISFAGRGEAPSMQRLKGGGASARKASIIYPVIFGTLYFLSIAMAIPALPNLVNTLVSGDASVSGAGQMKLGSLLVSVVFVHGFLHFPVHCFECVCVCVRMQARACVLSCVCFPEKRR